MKKFSRQEFERLFPDEAACLRFLFDSRIKGGWCVRCGRRAKFYKVEARRCLECGRCGSQIYPAAGTAMEGSRTPLRKWFEAIYLLSAAKGRLSACRLSRELGVTYKCAWRMRQRIRASLGEELAQKMSGTVEVDETYVGGRLRAKGKRRVGHNGRENKALVFGMRERGGMVKSMVVANTAEGDLLPHIERYVRRGSTVYSDEHKPYQKLPGMGYLHDFITHNKYKFKRGDVTTNRIEAYWSWMKKIIKGTYNHVSRRWLPLYLAEFDALYNLRNLSDHDRFAALLAKAAGQGKSAGHSQVIGKPGSRPAPVNRQECFVSSYR